MSYIGKCYRVLEDDEETMMQWPEIKTGFEFKILRTETRYGENETGVTRLICIKTSKIFDVNLKLENRQYESDESWFWCLIHMSYSKIEEIPESLAYEKLKLEIGKIQLNHFHAKEVDIAYALSAFASQEGCDSEEYDLMEAASQYIRYLESITAYKFADAVIEGDLDDWASDSFNDESRSETRNTGYILRSGVKKFIEGKQ